MKQLVEENKDEIAAIIIEPVGGNMGCIPPAPGFLHALRDICTREKILLIFDEVMTGFRLAPGGAQELYNIQADIITFGKIIGGGLPVGAYAARAEIMNHIAPVGKVYQAGTLSGNPLAMRAGLTLLSVLNNTPSIYKYLDKISAELETGLLALFNAAGRHVQINRVGSMISLHFNDKPVTDFKTAAASNNELFKKYFHHCLESGIYLPPSPFESWFISHAITTLHVEQTLNATKKFLKSN